MGNTPSEDLTAAIAEAVEATPLESDFDDSWNSWDKPTETDGEGAPETPEATPGESQSQTAETASQEPAAPETSEEQEPPTEYWGTDLSDLPAEKRAEILAHFEQQESTIHKLQQRLAESKTPEPVEEEADVQMTDEDILRAVGVDPEDYSLTDQAKAAILTMAKATMALEDRVESMVQKDQVRETQTIWNTELDSLETNYGKMPGSRLEQLRYAVEEGITSPEQLYFRLTADVRQEVEKAASVARRDALKRESQGGVKPRSGGGEAVVDLKGLSLREAVEKAARSAEKETGTRWRDAVKRKLIQSP